MICRFLFLSTIFEDDTSHLLLQINHETERKEWNGRNDARSRKQMNNDSYVKFSYIYIYMQKRQWTVIREVEMRDREDGGTPIPGNGGTKLARWFQRVTMISDSPMQEEADAMESLKGFLHGSFTKTDRAVR